MNPSHHYVEGVAAGTGPHNHHRGRLERDGAAVGYSVCDLGTGPLRACPDEPDPLERLLVKLATAREARAAARMPARGRPEGWRAGRHQGRGVGTHARGQGGQVARRSGRAHAAMSCEPEGLCRDDACALRSVSPLRFVPIVGRRAA
jgi:hypothetical protein